MVRVQPDEFLGFHTELAPGGEEFAESLGDLPRTVTDEIVTGRLAPYREHLGRKECSAGTEVPLRPLGEGP